PAPRRSRQADRGGGEEGWPDPADGGAALATDACPTAPRRQSERVLEEPERLPRERRKQGASGTVVAGDQRRDRVTLREIQVFPGEVSTVKLARACWPCLCSPSI